MSEWAEVDALKTQVRAKPPRIAHHGRVVFATSRAPIIQGRLDEIRFVSWPSGDEILVLRPCWFAPGRWRALDRRRVESVRLGLEVDDETRWWGVDVRALLVALDSWLEAGCPPRRWVNLAPPVEADSLRR